MLSILAWLAAATSLVAASAGSHDCVIAGPEFPSPQKLSGSKLLSEAIETFENHLANADLGLKPNDTAWGVALFSAKENKTIYEHFYSPPIDIGGDDVDRDSVFRIGSVSKVFSVYSFLIEVGDDHFNEPITKYVPELANRSSHVDPDIVYDDINNVKWEEVTLGELASHAAGIPRDPTGNDLTAKMTVDAAEQSYGLPPLGEDQVLTCDTPSSKSCSRKQLLSKLLEQHPSFATQHSPAYSNIAYTLLGYAQEVITGKTLSSSVESGIIKALGMRNSSYEKTPERGIIPGNDASAVGWNTSLGGSAPSGSFYSSTADMVKAGQAMLRSTLMLPSQTRRWFRPLIQTGYATSAVGAPWEIRYLTQPDQHLVEAYTKEGDLGYYHAGFALSPQHDIGWVVLTATTPSATDDVRGKLFDTMGDIFIPMAEQQARREAVANFNGTYVDTASNSSVTILVEGDDRPGLKIPLMMARGKEIVGPNSVLIQEFSAGQSGRLYPSQLRTIKRTSDGNGTYNARLGFRATFFNETATRELEDPCLAAWTAFGAPTYGQAALDDWVFEMGQDGNAEAVDIRMWKLNLKRTHIG